MKKCLCVILVILLSVVFSTSALYAASSTDDYAVTESDSVLSAELTAAVIAVAIAGVVVGVSAGKMKKTGAVGHANSYLTKNGFRLTKQSDVFLYSRVTKMRVESSSSGSRSRIGR